MSDAGELVNIDIADGVALLTLNRPDALNALSQAMTRALLEAIEQATSDESVLAVVLTGRGKAFCAGVDLKELAGGNGMMGADNLGPESQIMRAMRDCPKPLIGAINGFAVTGGFEVALACDFLYAADTARFADTHARVGLLPGWGLSQKLPRLVGINRAREISFTGNYFSADEAYAWGLVNRVLPQEQLLPETLATARQIAESEPDALPRIKQMMNEGWEMSLGDGLSMEGERSGAYNSRKSVAHMEQRLQELRARSKRA
ncbi:MAG: enoyl-CoA hydratase [Pseudomonadota bacterium]